MKRSLLLCLTLLTLQSCKNVNQVTTNPYTITGSYIVLVDSDEHLGDDLFEVYYTDTFDPEYYKIFVSRFNEILEEETDDTFWQALTLYSFKENEIQLPEFVSKISSANKSEVFLTSYDGFLILNEDEVDLVFLRDNEDDSSSERIIHLRKVSSEISVDSIIREDVDSMHRYRPGYKENNDKALSAFIARKERLQSESQKLGELFDLNDLNGLYEEYIGFSDHEFAVPSSENIYANSRCQVSFKGYEAHIDGEERVRWCTGYYYAEASEIFSKNYEERFPERDNKKLLELRYVENIADLSIVGIAEYLEKIPNIDKSTIIEAGDGCFLLDDGNISFIQAVWGIGKELGHGLSYKGGIMHYKKISSLPPEQEIASRIEVLTECGVSLTELVISDYLNSYNFRLIKTFSTTFWNDKTLKEESIQMAFVIEAPESINQSFSRSCVIAINPNKMQVIGSDCDLTEVKVKEWNRIPGSPKIVL